jgi:hypothetical protein
MVRILKSTTPYSASSPVKKVIPLLLPISSLTLLPLEALLIVLQSFKAVHEKLMYLL